MPKAQRKAAWLSVRFTEEELNLVARAARARNQTTSNWARAQLLTAARKLFEYDSAYGLSSLLFPVPLPPPGWVILPAGAEVPQVHMECHETYAGEKGVCRWLAPRRCRSTMTAITAQIWGAVRAYAVPVDSTNKP